MTPLHMDGATHRMIANDDDTIGGLWVKCEVIDGVTYISSRWEPTPDELALLNAGGSVELRVMHGQPPVSIIAVPPA